MPALALATVLAGTGASTPPPALDLPWGALHAGLVVAQAVSAPVRMVWRPVLAGASAVPVLDRIGRPAEQVLGLVDAGLPLAVAGSALAGDVADSWPSVTQVDSGASPAWQVSALPDVSSSLGPLGGLVEGLRSRLDSAVACDCLGSAAQSRLGAWAATAGDAAWALSSFGPLATAVDDLAGFDGPRTYLVVIGNQAEMRPSGGAPLYLAVVTADAGLISIADKGTTSSHFFPPMNRPVTWSGPEGNAYFPANPRTMPFVSAGANPDFSVSAQEMAAAFEAGGHPPVDGVIYVDMTLLQQVLDLTGPIEVDGLGAVDAASLVPKVLDNAYDDVELASANARRQAANDALFDALLARVSSGLPPRETLRVIEDAVAGRHLQAWFRDSGTQSVFGERGWTGELAAPATTDWLAWYTQSGNPSKTDIRQSLSVERTVDADGRLLRVGSVYSSRTRTHPGTARRPRRSAGTRPPGCGRLWSSTCPRTLSRCPSGAATAWRLRPSREPPPTGR